MEIDCLIMLPKENRLSKKKDIERVFKEGKGFKEDFLILKIVKNGLKNSRFAFIVPQQVSKKASLRNKLRRRLRELVRLKFKKIKGGLDLVFLATPGLEEKDFWELDETINKLFQKTKCFKD